MNNHRWSPRSWANLASIRPILGQIACRALQLSVVDISAVSGLRTIEEQERLVRAGKSWTLDSRHLTGDAIDLQPYPPPRSPDDLEGFILVGQAMREAAAELGVDLTWGAPVVGGGDWVGRSDWYHWELPRARERT